VSATAVAHKGHISHSSIDKHDHITVFYFMAALWNRAGHIYFHPVVCSFTSFFLSSPNLSRRRLDVYHTSTHGVTLVRIWNAGLKRAARRSLEMQDAKNRQKVAICAPSYNFVGLYLCN